MAVQQNSAKEQLALLVKLLPLGLKLLAIFAALGVVVVGVYSLRDSWPPAPVDAAFTRVGGATSIDTALDASRFWLSPPRAVVEVPADASQHLMLRAAGCAIRKHAPLLLTSANPAELRLVAVTTRSWQKASRAARLPRTRIVYFWRLGPRLTHCVAGGHVASQRFALLKAPTQQRLHRLLPSVRDRHMLAPFVVFAAAIGPRRLPDVAVGLALAAHLAAARHAPISLLAVQPYLEADPALEERLRSQFNPVTGGVVLGQTPTVPDDTVALLRQLLRSPDQQSWLDQVQGNLEQLGPLIAALLAVIGVAAVAKAAEPVIARLKEVSNPPPPGTIRTGTIQTDLIQSGVINTGVINTGERPGPPSPPPGPPRRWRPSMPTFRKVPAPTTPGPADWLEALGGDKLRKVTVWLRSGFTVTGILKAPDNAGTDKLWRLDKPEYLPSNAVPGSDVPQPSTTLEYLLVPAEDILLIGVSKT